MATADDYGGMVKEDISPAAERKPTPPKTIATVWGVDSSNKSLLVIGIDLTSGFHRSCPDLRRPG